MESEKESEVISEEEKNLINDWIKGQLGFGS